MTAPHIIDPAGMLGQALSQASPDLMRSLLQHVINALLSADADTACGAQWGQQDPQHHAQRNGQRHWPWTPGVTLGVNASTIAGAPTAASAANTPSNMNYFIRPGQQSHKPTVNNLRTDSEPTRLR